MEQPELIESMVTTLAQVSCCLVLLAPRQRPTAKLVLFSPWPNVVYDQIPKAGSRSAMNFLQGAMIAGKGTSAASPQLCKL